MFDAFFSSLSSFGLLEKGGFHIGRTFTVIALLIALFLVFENISGWIYLATIDRKIALLGELQELSEAGIEQNSELNPLYQEMIEDIEKHDTHSFFLRVGIGLGNYESNKFAKFLSGASLWLLVALVGLLMKGKDKLAFLVMGLAFAIPAGYIAIVLPTFIHPLVNWIGYPIFWFAFVILLGKLPKKNPSSVA